MKRLWRSRTIWSAVTLPVVGWVIQWRNGGTLPVFVQTCGPLLVCVGIVLLRMGTNQGCLCGRKRK